MTEELSGTGTSTVPVLYQKKIVSKNQNFTSEKKGFPDPPKKRKNHNYVSNLVH